MNDDDIYLVMCETRDWGGGVENVTVEVVGTYKAERKANAEATAENQREARRRVAAPHTTYSEHYWVAAHTLIT